LAEIAIDDDAAVVVGRARDVHGTDAALVAVEQIVTATGPTGEQTRDLPVVDHRTENLARRVVSLVVGQIPHPVRLEQVTLEVEHLVELLVLPLIGASRDRSVSRVLKALLQ